MAETMTKAPFQLRDVRGGIRYHEQSLAIHREIGDRRGEGVTLGNLGNAYLGLGDAPRAIGYYEQQLVITREIGNRDGEGSALDGLGVAYKRLGDARRAIGYYEQALIIRREIGDRQGEAFGCWNLGLLYEQQGNLTRAAELMQVCVDFEREIGHPDAEKDAARVACLRRGETTGDGPSPAQVLQRFGPVIEAVVAADRGHRQARAAVEAAFGQFERGGWRIVDPIRCIWAGERDEAKLTAEIDPNSALIVREILKQLKS